MSDFPGGEKNEDIFRRTGQTVDLRTETALRALWEAMPWGLKISLPGGEDATIEKFVEPRKNAESGVWEFGFDARDTQGNWHIEFFVVKMGWGGRPIEPMEIPEKPE